MRFNCLFNNSKSYTLRTFSIILLLCVNIMNCLKCICNPHDCDPIVRTDCPGKGLTVMDPCKCCKVCAKTEGEVCGGLGGFSGLCEPPLKCISKVNMVIGTGICFDLTTPSMNSVNDIHQFNKENFRSCPETTIIQPGCEIVDRKCECWSKPITVCKGNFKKWDFENLEECAINLANLVESEIEFDEDYTIPPKMFVLPNSIGKRRRKVFSRRTLR